MKKCRIGNAFPMGATVINSKAVQFVTKVNKRKNKGLVLYDKKTGEREEYALTEEFQIGNVYSIILEDVAYDRYTYNFIENGKEIRDPYAKVICGNGSWGDAERTLVSAGIGVKKYDWEDDQAVSDEVQQFCRVQQMEGFLMHEEACAEESHQRTDDNAGAKDLHGSLSLDQRNDLSGDEQPEQVAQQPGGSEG